jgi:2,3-bisphosphoglycerate-independent phosphoglycerate mutase
MKYVVILGDGMADLPLKELGGKTPLEYAQKPNMDSLAKISEIGLVKTVPDGMKPGSDTANLSAMGYDPEIYYTGRSPLEAVSMGIELDADDTAFRCNLVNISGSGAFEDKIMADYSSDEITTEEAAEIIKYSAKHFNNEFLTLYNGISYRHCLVWKGLDEQLNLTPPHDISGKKIAKYLPQGKNGQILLEIMKKSNEILCSHKVNVDRERRGLKAGNCLWFWGQGKKPALRPFKELYGIDGAVISAVDLIKGIAICAELKVIPVEGATGNIKTNFKGKAEAALSALKKGSDFVYIHIEAPDECGHRKEIENKVRSIELIDNLVVKTVKEGLDKSGEPYMLLVMPDHPTPIATGTHSADPVPYMLYDSRKRLNSKALCYSENSARESGIYVDKGCTMIKKMLDNK